MFERRGSGPGFSFPIISYQGRGVFRGHGNLLLMVETLLMRCVQPAPDGVSKLWLAAACVLCSPFTSLSSSWFLFFFSADVWTLHSLKRLPGKIPWFLSRSMNRAAGIFPILIVLIPIFGIDCTGTGATGDGVCLRGNLPRGFGFGLTGKRWRCGLGTRLRPTHRYRPRQVHRSGAWMVHPWPPWSGLRLDPLQWPPMLQATECKITTGFRDEPLPY